MTDYFGIISNQRKGIIARLARAALYVLSVFYRFILAVRNFYYDMQMGQAPLERPCISIGNLTTGGTGKTPLVEWLANECIRVGRKVAILSRGYKGKDRVNDELQMVSSICPQALCVANPDRVKGGRYAIEEHNVELLILDDGFQHRRIGRDIDLVLVDATSPFGYGHVLPRGLLREPLGNLERADVVVISRASQVEAGKFKEIKDQCAHLAPTAEILACNHQPTEAVDIQGNHSDLSLFTGSSILAFAGIGNPQAFENTITSMCSRPVKMQIFDDHHHYTTTDCHRICEQAQKLEVDLLLTTEKDMIKLKELEFEWPLPLWALKIKIDFIGQGGKILLDLVEQLFREEPYLDGTAPLPTD